MPSATRGLLKKPPWNPKTFETFLTKAFASPAIPCVSICPVGTPTPQDCKNKLTTKLCGYSEAAMLRILVPDDVATRPSSLSRRLNTAVLGKPKTAKHRGQKTHKRGYIRGSAPYARFFGLVFLGCAKKMNITPILRNSEICSHNPPLPLCNHPLLDTARQIWYNKATKSD